MKKRSVNGSKNYEKWLENRKKPITIHHIQGWFLFGNWGKLPSPQVEQICKS